MNANTQTTTVRIRCINKTNRLSAHERIAAIGGVNADNTRWRLMLDQAITGIKDGRWRFYVDVNGKSVAVIVAISAAGREYLKTENDGEQPNNLLSLPECPL